MIGIALVPLTAMSIYLVYGAYLFSKWPWMRFSMVMATLTYLWTYTFWFARITGAKEDEANPFFFGLVVVPFDVILMYPGLETLEINSDSNGALLLFVLAVVHGCGFYLIQREIQRYLRASMLNAHVCDRCGRDFSVIPASLSVLTRFKLKLGPSTTGPVEGNMNRKQKVVFWLGIIVFALMGIFPPWRYTFAALDRGGGMSKPAGYGFIFDPPTPLQDFPPFGIVLDGSRLMVQWLMVAAFTTALIVTLRKKPAPPPMQSVQPVQGRLFKEEEEEEEHETDDE